SLRNAKNMIDTLKGSRTNDKPPKLILNQVGQPKRPEIPTKEFGAAVGLEPALTIPFDPQVFGQAANNGQMVAEVQPNSKPGEALRMRADLLTGGVVTTASKKAGFLPFLRKAG